MFHRNLIKPRFGRVSEWQVHWEQDFGGLEASAWWTTSLRITSATLNVAFKEKFPWGIYFLHPGVGRWWIYNLSSFINNFLTLTWPWLQTGYCRNELWNCFLSWVFPGQKHHWKSGGMMLLEKFLVQFLLSWKTSILKNFSTFPSFSSISLNFTFATLALINNKEPNLKWMHVKSIP